MPLTPAEKMRLYRERLKENPEKMEEQRKKNLERIKSKYSYKKVKDMSEEEKKKQRKKWREQKRKNKEKKKPATENSSEINAVPDTKRLIRSRNMYRKQLNNAQSRIEYLKRLTETLRKRMYRAKQKHLKTEKKLEKRLDILKVRNEVLELSLKVAYKRCHTYKEKNLLKTLADHDAVKENEATSYIGRSLGLKGKIRRKPKVARVLKTKQSIVNFFLRDDVSRATAGKRECRTLHKNKEQIRYLNNSLQCLYDKYKREIGNPVSFAVNKNSFSFY